MILRSLSRNILRRPSILFKWLSLQRKSKLEIELKYNIRGSDEYEKKGKVKNEVRYYRRLYELTQEQLSEKVGIHRQTIIAIEKQKYDPSISIVLKLSAVLNEPVERLFFFENEIDN
ncbi:helix-turn-helix transcriptional regulator [Priestia megaterium]|nr:helix-turn-helix transcriptional regulator [Priestia megaterium]